MILHLRRLRRNERGAAVIETAFVLPVFIALLWMVVQLAQVYRGLAGIQQALGEGARYATLCVNPDASNGCKVPNSASIENKIKAAVYGVGPGTFDVDKPVKKSAGTGDYYDLTVTYTQPTTLLVYPGPTIKVSRSKRVWIAGTSAAS